MVHEPQLDTDQNQHLTENLNNTEGVPAFELLELVRQQGRRIDVDMPLDVALDDSGGVAILASIRAGEQQFQLLRKDNQQGGKDIYLIEQEQFNFDRTAEDPYAPQPGIMRIAPNVPLVFGKDNTYGDNFTYDKGVAKEHFVVSYAVTEEGEEVLEVANMDNKKTTVVESNQEAVNQAEPAPAPKWGNQQPEQDLLRPKADSHRTKYSVDRIAQERAEDYREPDENAPYGYYKDRPILGRDSRSVMNGVYLGGSAREAIVVNADSILLRAAYRDLKEKIEKQAMHGDIRGMLTAAREMVAKVMPYDGDKVDKISAKYNGDQLVNIDEYILKKAGVCRHQGLFSAYMIERLINDGYLSGTVGVERNTVIEHGGSHGWAVFTPAESGDEDKIVVDAAQGFVGTKQRALEEGRWRYALATENYRSS